MHFIASNEKIHKILWGGKNMFLVSKYDDVLDKYNENWDKIKGELNIKFHSMADYDKKYIKSKVG